MRFLYPSSMLKATRVDEHFQNEVDVLDEAPVLYSELEDRLVLRGEDIRGTTIIYRGWILSPKAYVKLEDLVLAAGAKTLVSSAAYSRSQFAERWLNVFEDLTPRTTAYSYSTDTDVIGQDYAGSSNSYIVKGSSKSLKHDWNNSMFAKTGADVSRVVANFKEQVSEVEESFVLVRDFEDWVPGELRVWWIDDRFVVDQHPNNNSFVDFGESFVIFLTDTVRPLIDLLDAGFVATDFVRDSSGSFRLVEVGNGQVSEAKDFKKIVHMLNKNLV